MHIHTNRHAQSNIEIKKTPLTYLVLVFWEEVPHGSGNVATFSKDESPGDRKRYRLLEEEEE